MAIRRWTPELVRTAQLFPSPPVPRIKRMHVDDAGQGIAQFKCRICGHVSDWLQIESVTEAKRGIPCPNCNGSAAK